MILSVTGHHFWERLIQIVFTVGMWNFDTLIVVLHRSHQWNGISIHQQINELSAINLTFSDFIAVTGHPRQIHISNRDCFWTVGVRNIKFDLFQNWNRDFWVASLTLRSGYVGQSVSESVSQPLFTLFPLADHDENFTGYVSWVYLVTPRGARS